MSISSMNVNMLIRLSQITKLLDMPHYAFLRMQLLRPNKYPHLINSLKGILMLLPQGKAFDYLKNRLECSALIFDSTLEKVKPVQDTKTDCGKYLSMVIEANMHLFPNINKAAILEML